MSIMTPIIVITVFIAVILTIAIFGYFVMKKIDQAEAEYAPLKKAILNWAKANSDETSDSPPTSQAGTHSKSTD